LWGRAYPLSEVHQQVQSNLWIYCKQIFYMSDKQNLYYLNSLYTARHFKHMVYPKHSMAMLRWHFQRIEIHQSQSICMTFWNRVSDVEWLCNVEHEVPGGTNSGIWWLPFWLAVYQFIKQTYSNLYCTQAAYTAKHLIKACVLSKAYKCAFIASFNAASCELSLSQCFCFSLSSFQSRPGNTSSLVIGRFWSILCFCRFKACCGHNSVIENANLSYLTPP